NTDATTRLRLDSVQVLDKAGSVMQHYRFDYNTATALPGYTSKKQDYWGYFNNVDNDLLTPQLTIPYVSCSTCTPINVTIGSQKPNGRACDATAMQAFILNGIHYPTGGYSIFTWEANQYYRNDTLQLAGGLRVKTISSYDGISPTPIVKTYVNNTARANFNISDQYFCSYQTHQNWGASGFGLGAVIYCTAMIRSFNSSPHTDLEGLDGATVVYPFVTEYIGTPGNNVGRTDYKFTDATDTLLEASMSGTQIFASAFYRRGHLLSKKEFISKGSGLYQPVKDQRNGYTAFPASMYPFVALAVYKNVYNEGVDGANPMIETNMTATDDLKFGAFTFAWYNISSDDNYLVADTTRTYDTNDTTKYTTSITTYKYDNIAHQQVTRTYHTDSRGNTLVATTKYPADYPAGNPVIDSMVNRNMQAEAVEKYDTLKNAASGINGIVSGQFNKFKTGSIAHTIVPFTISTLSVAQPLTTFTPSNVVSGSITADSHYVKMMSFDDYDTQNNLTQYTPRNATPTAILWDHTYELPVAQIKNAPNYSSSVTAYAYTGFEADSKGGWTYSGGPLFDPSAPAGSFSYPLSAGAITSGVIDNTRSYVLSYWSNNASAATVTYNSTGYPGTALRATGGWTYYEHQLPTITGASAISISGTMSIDELRLYPIHAQMTTYNYDPSGLRSISDTKGANSYFDYDYLQRLKNIKDWAGNIVKNYGYHLYDQLFGNQSQTNTYTRQVCPVNTTPGSLTFTVPANKYYGSTQASANADAIYDMNLNGQIKANANCHCVPDSATVTLTNTTGLSGFQATFSGIGTPFNFNTGSTPLNIKVPVGNSYTISVNGVGGVRHTYGLTGFSNQTDYTASFSPVSLTKSVTLTLSVQ